MTPSSPARRDAELVRRGRARSRGRAAELIRAGQVSVEGVHARKPALLVSDSAELSILRTSGDPDHVSRGGTKLHFALDQFTRSGLRLTGRLALDAGASTGGFTEVLLRCGAAGNAGYFRWLRRGAADISAREIADLVAAPLVDDQVST